MSEVDNAVETKKNATPTKFTTSQQVVMNGHLQPVHKATANDNPPPAKEENIEGEGAAENLNGNAATTTTTDDAPELTTDQLKAWFKKNNINFDGDEKTLKEKLEYTPPAPPAPEPTAEELNAREIAKEKRMLDLWTKNGGKPEDFYNIKKTAAADVAQLSESELRRELTDEGFATKEEQDEIIQHRYFQQKLDDIEQEEDETDDAFAKRKEALEKKVKYGAKKLANRSIHIKNAAAKLLENFAKQIDAEDAERQEEETIAKNVVEHFKNMPKETVIDLGEIAPGVKVAPIKHDVSETSIQQAMNILKDPQEREKIFNNPDGSLNLPNLARLLVNDFEQQRLSASIYAEATTRNTEEFKKKFPYTSAQGLGTGSAPAKTQPNLTPTKAGQPTKVKVY